MCLFRWIYIELENDEKQEMLVKRNENVKEETGNGQIRIGNSIEAGKIEIQFLEIARKSLNSETLFTLWKILKVH